MTTNKLNFFSRLRLACQVLGNAELAAKLVSAPAASAPLPSGAAVAAKVTVGPVSQEESQAGGLAVLGLLQQEGRLIDFLREEVAAFSDAEIGAAVRVVHAGCRKVLDQYFVLEAACKGAEGDTVNLPVGYDAQRVRITGNVTGQAPFRGTLRHHGWVATVVKLPTLSKAVDARVIAPAEVEL